MYSSGSSRRTHTGVLKFTAYSAAAYVLEHASTFAVNYYDDTDRPLLNELNTDGYNKIKQLVQKTFPNVSTYCSIATIPIGINRIDISTYTT